MSLKFLRSIFCVGFSIILTACASAPPSPTTSTQNPEKPSVTATDVLSPQEQISKLQDKVQDLETRLSALNEKINLQMGGSTAAVAEGTSLSAKPATSAPITAAPITSLPTEVVKAHPTDVNPTRTKKIMVKDASKEAPSNEIVDRFREAKILFDSKRYSDSMLEFSEFVKNEPDHTLAPAAQYYVGLSYLKQKEYKLAEEELSRGLISFPHSNYTPDYLLSLAQVSESLEKPERVLYFKQKLLANFPNSPQAKVISLDKAPARSTKGPIEKIRLPEEPTQPNTPTEPSVVGGDT